MRGLLLASFISLSGAVMAQYPTVRVRLKSEVANFETAAKVAAGVGKVARKVNRDTYDIRVTSKGEPKEILSRVAARSSVLSANSLEPSMDPKNLSDGRLEILDQGVELLEEAWEWHCEATGLPKNTECPGLDYLETLLQRLKERAFPFAKPDYTGLYKLAQERAQQGGAGITAGLTWQFLGPRNLNIPYRTYYGQRPINGRVNALAYHPVSAGTYFLGAAKGGVWKTTDAGVNWTALTDNWPLLGVSSLAVDPTNGNLVLAGTGDFDGGNSIGFGVMRSNDGGSTWTQTGAGVMGGACIGDIVFHPDNPNVVMAVTGKGTGGGRGFRSTDGGLTWSVALNVIADWKGVDVSVSNQGQRTMWAAGDSASGTSKVFKSIDNGATWTQVTVPSLGSSALDIACSKVDPSTVYILDCGAQRIWKTTNAGTTWTDTTTNFSNQWGQSWYDWHINTSRLNSTDVVYVGLIDIAVSHNGGTSWRNMGGANWTATYSGSAITHNDQHSFAVNPANPNEVLVGNDGGVYRAIYNPSTDTITWGLLSRNLGITQFYNLAVHPTNANYAMGGTQDNATPHSFGDLNNWGNPGAGDGAGCAINPSNPANQYHSWQGNNIEKTENSFGSKQGITPSWTGHSVPFIGELWLDPTNPNLLYANTNYMNRYDRSTNQWTLKLGNQAFGGIVQSFAVAPTDGNRLYVGRGAQVWMSVDKGAVWKRIDQLGQSGGLTNRTITDISVHPSNPNSLIVVQGGSGTAKVFQCTNPTDAAPTWTPYMTGLPDIHHTCFARDPQRPNTHWYVGNDTGVWRTTNGGASWSDYTVPNGLPNVEVTQMVANVTTGYLNASTYGRGMWRIPLNNSETVSPNNVAIQLGQVSTGSTGDLATADGNALVICKFLVPNQSSPIVQFEATATTTITGPTSFSLTSVTRSADAGSFQQVLSLYDYSSGSFTTTRIDALTMNFATFVLGGQGNLTNYVRQGDGEVKVRVQIQQVGPSTALLPCSGFDQLVWNIQG